MLDRLARIKLLAMDVDGTLTDGSMIVHNGEQIKCFHAHDGLGIRLAMNHGLEIAWITGNTSAAVADRARALGVEDVYQGSWYKSDALDEIAAKHGLSREQIAYIGDDLNDLPAFDRAGVAIAVGNAAEEVKKRADVVTQRCGGDGAVREAIELIFRSRGEWEDAVAGFLAELEREKAGKAGPEAVA